MVNAFTGLCLGTVTIRTPSPKKQDKIPSEVTKRVRRYQQEVHTREAARGE